MEKELKIYLSPTAIIDSDHPSIQALVNEVTKGVTDPIQKAIRLYYKVRDGIRYDPYYPFYKPEHYRASLVLKSGRGYCVSKASVLCAVARAAGIPARLGFADVINHLSTTQLRNYMGSDLFVYHGFNELFLEGKWVKATPAFNRELCARHGVAALDFDGLNDSLFQPFSMDSRRFMEYVRYHGSFADVPVDRIVRAWKEAYGEERVASWMEAFEKHDGTPRDFSKEEVFS